MQTCIVLTSRGELVSAVPPEKGGGGLSATFKIGCSSGFGHELLDGPIEPVANNRSQLKICSCKAVLGCLKCSSRIVRLMTMKKKLYQRPTLTSGCTGLLKPMIGQNKGPKRQLRVQHWNSWSCCGYLLYQPSLTNVFVFPLHWLFHRKAVHAYSILGMCMTQGKIS